MSSMFIIKALQQGFVDLSSKTPLETAQNYIKTTLQNLILRETGKLAKKNLEYSGYGSNQNLVHL